MQTRISATVDLEGGRVEGRTEAGHLVAMDTDPPHGANTAASPVETLLASLAGCTAIDVASILRKKRQTAEAYDVSVVAERAAEHPKVVTRVTVEHRVRGAVEVAALARAIELSATRYCPISAMLSASAVVEHRYRLTGSDGSTDEGVVSVLGPEDRAGLT